MAACTTPTNNPGRLVAVEYAIGCGDDDFINKTYLPLGSMNAKDLTYSATTADNTSDTSGGFTSEIVIRTGMDVAVSGFTLQDSAVSAQNALVIYYFTELQAGRQPTVWLRVSGNNYPLTWHIFSNYKGGTEGFGTNDPQSISFDFSVTDTGSANLSVNVT